MFNDYDSFGGTAVLEDATAVIHDYEADATQLGPKIAANMCGVDLVVRRPSGKYQIKNVEVMAANEDGSQERLVDNKKITRPSFITTTRSGNTSMRTAGSLTPRCACSRSATPGVGFTLCP